MLVESLEPRCFLSATLSHGVLTIKGSNARDVLSITYQTQTGPKIQYVEQLGNRGFPVKYFARKAVKKIVVKALGGNDLVVLNFKNAIPFSLDGGSGNDQIDLTNPGKSTVQGGAGNDTVWGGAGNDLIQGGPGNDSLDGRYGNDTLVGEAGTDVLLGNFGNDLLKTRDGVFDSATGGPGKDKAQIDFNPDNTRKDFVSFDTEQVV